MFSSSSLPRLFSFLKMPSSFSVRFSNMRLYPVFANDGVGGMTEGGFSPRTPFQLPAGTMRHCRPFTFSSSPSTIFCACSRVSNPFSLTRYQWPRSLSSAESMYGA